MLPRIASHGATTIVATYSINVPISTQSRQIVKRPLVAGTCSPRTPVLFLANRIRREVERSPVPYPQLAITLLFRLCLVCKG